MNHIPPQQKIHCIGDSHVNLFSGVDNLQGTWPQPRKNLLPQFEVYRIGAGLAYNLIEEGSSTNTRERVSSVVQTIPENAHIMLCFGEIDCRYHLIKIAKKHSREWSDVADQCAQRYFDGFKFLLEKGFKVSIYNAIPSTRWTKLGIQFPTTGSCEERNRMTILFNSSLKRRCEKASIPFIHNFDALTNKSGLTNSLYYLDKIHLAQRALPLTMKAMEDAIPDFEFEAPKWHKLRIFGSWLHLMFRIRRLLQIPTPKAD